MDLFAAGAGVIVYPVKTFSMCLYKAIKGSGGEPAAAFVVSFWNHLMRR